jgi:hypothetical protein
VVAPVAPPPWWYRLAASALAIGLVGLQVAAIVAYVDDWPVGSNAMFSFRRVASDDVYDLVINVEIDGSWRRLDPTADLGAIDTEAFRRQLFSKWYGSSDPSFPQGTVGVDDPAQFRARMTELCRSVADAMSDRGRSAHGLMLSVERLARRGDRWVVIDTRMVGACTPISAAFAVDPALVNPQLR